MNINYNNKRLKINEEDNYKSYNKTNNIKGIDKIKTLNIFFFSFLVIFFILIMNKSYAAEVKYVITPKNPRVGDTFEIKADLVGSDIYSISFINLDESSNLEYLDMDSQKKSSDDKALTDGIKAKYKVKKAGEAWIKANVKLEYANLKNKKLDLENIQVKNIEKTVNIAIVPEATNITKIEGKFKITDDEVNIRPYPSTEYSSLGILNKDDEIEVVGEKDKWYQFKYKDEFAFVHEDFVKKLSNEDENESNLNNEQNDVEQTIIDEKEEIKDSKVKDPKDVKDNTLVLIILSILIIISIIASIIYLLKNKDKNNDNTGLYGKDSSKY